MPNTIKFSTVLWVLAGLLLAPFVFFQVMPVFGIYLGVSTIHIWIVSLPLCGYYAYRSYKRGSAPELAGATAQVTRTREPLSGGAYFLAAVLGGGLGFGGGYLTRPTFLGQKVPLQILTAQVDETFARVRDELVVHLTIAVGLGLVTALVLTFLAASLRRS